MKTETLSILSADGETIHIKKSKLSEEDQRDILDYWINVRRFIEGSQDHIGEWTSTTRQVGGYSLLTDPDLIKMVANYYAQD